MTMKESTGRQLSNSKDFKKQTVDQANFELG